VASEPPSPSDGSPPDPLDPGVPLDPLDPGAPLDPLDPLDPPPEPDDPAWVALGGVSVSGEDAQLWIG
jgi:hypothetical protein